MPVLDLDNPKNLNNYPQAIEILPPDYFVNIFKSFDISNLFIKSMLETFNIINKNMGQILASQLASAKFMDVFKNYYSPSLIIDSEPEANLALPLPKISNKARLGILMTKIGTFKYKRKTLSKLSMKNSEGKVLVLFMNSDLFASDEDIRKITNAEGNREFSWVLRNLKYKFKDNGLCLTLERIWNPNGYIIQNITYLQ